jgi:hypothetical protein
MIMTGLWTNAMHRRIATNYNLKLINTTMNFMRANVGIFIFMSLLFLVGTVMAVGGPDTITVNTSKNWTIANNFDQSTIIITTTAAGTGVENVNLTLSIDPSYGTLSPTTVATNISGMATSTFRVKTKSGRALITAAINGNGLSGSTIQNIDHDVPAKTILQYPLEGEVGSELPFNISVFDRWGNPIDGNNTQETHAISLRIDGPSNDCGFNDGIGGYPRTFSHDLDINGNLSLKVRLSTKAGDHNIQIASPFTLSLIIGTSSRIPYSMTGIISPEGNLPANNIDFFTIDYFLYDEYGNPVRNRSVWVNTTPSDEQKMFTSDSYGQIRLYYGPMVSAGDITLNATTLDEPYISKELIAHFINSGPKNMVLKVTPQNIASREVKPDSVAYVRATVIDQYGNPVPGQSVSFDITDINTGVFNTSVPNGTPSFDHSSVVKTITGITDSDGNAIVIFYPGSFAQAMDPGFSYAASATCIIKAQWNSTTRSTIVSWKNYPFLSVEATATPQNIKLNDTFDVSITVTGDGYAMPGGGVCAILDQDCSASMKNPDTNNQDRLTNSKEAAKAFVDTMKDGAFIGLISYGTENNNQFHLAPQPDMELVKTQIDSLQQGTKSKNLSPSITEAMHNITSTQWSRPKDKVRAVIVLNDGNSNIQNQGEMDALVSYATSQDPKIFIFPVLYLDPPTKPPTSENIRQMDELANRTGGIMYIPKSPEDLKNIYIGIGLNLTRLAGVNATMQINYTTFEVDSQRLPGGMVFDYVPVGPFSPFQTVINPEGRTSIIWPNYSQSVIDQTNEWNANHQLHYDIGTLNISDQWQTTYRLKANQTGMIKLFDNTSTVSFNDGQDILKFPDVFVIVTPNGTPLSNQTGVKITNLAVTSGDIIDNIPFAWNLKYEGRATATETLWYSYNNAPWIQFDTRVDIEPGNYYQIGQLDVKQSLPGSYRIKVRARAPEGVDEKITGPIIVGKTGAYIKLE